MLVVATAGHVDHGKSTLVRALTGTDPDRSPESRARGLTIDLGFAWTALPGRGTVAFVDVPGHVRFLPNMLAGAGAVRSCLMVVDAREGWRDQTEEHLRLLELLGVLDGVVALTKADTVDPGQLERVASEVRARLRGSFLDSAPVLATDSLTDRGIGDLRTALARLAERVPAPDDRVRPRLWIDRCFSLRGVGTVVTGTLAGGALELDEPVEVVTGAGVRRARIRGLQSLGQDRVRVEPGWRVAVNLVGVDREDVARGDAVVRPGQWHLTRSFDASVTVLVSPRRPLLRRGAHVLYVGSGEHPVRLGVIGGERIEPATTGSVRIALARPLPLLPGDRFVLRDSGPGHTVGGGEVLDVDPVLPLRRARPDRTVDRVIAERVRVRPDELERLTGVRREATVAGWVLDTTAMDRRRTELARAVRGSGPLGFDLAPLDEVDRALVGALDGVQTDAGRARLVEEDPLLSHPVFARLRDEGFGPAAPTRDDRPVLLELRRRGLVVERDGLVFATESLERAARVVAELLHGQPEGVRLAEVRDALGTSRRHALALLELLDGRGVTRRQGDRRLAGRRLPSADARD